MKKLLLFIMIYHTWARQSPCHYTEFSQVFYTDRQSLFCGTLLQHLKDDKAILYPGREASIFVTGEDGFIEVKGKEQRVCRSATILTNNHLMDPVVCWQVKVDLTNQRLERLSSTFIVQEYDRKGDLISKDCTINQVFDGQRIERIDGQTCSQSFCNSCVPSCHSLISNGFFLCDGLVRKRGDPDFRAGNVFPFAVFRYGGERAVICVDFLLRYGATKLDLGDYINATRSNGSGEEIFLACKPEMTNDIGRMCFHISSGEGFDVIHIRRWQTYFSGFRVTTANVEVSVRDPTNIALSLSNEACPHMSCHLWSLGSVCQEHSVESLDFLPLLGLLSLVLLVVSMSICLFVNQRHAKEKEDY